MPRLSPWEATVREGGAQAHAPARSPRGSDGEARYRWVRELGRGGMGRVVEALDTRLSRTVAVKEILEAHPDARVRFEREIAITARLEHPSIVPLYDVGASADGSPFYVMRKVDGEPLDTRIRAATTLDQRLRLVPHVLALADAVAHAHARGVIHRDLKPTNVIVGELGETIVIDWGLAKLIAEPDDPDEGAAVPSACASMHTAVGTVFGTPGFMAPEQRAGERLDERVDVYALGACLYHVLAGQPPPLDGTPRRLAEIVDGVPPDLATIVGVAMASDRRARYLDAGGFSEDLRRFLGGQLVAAHDYPLRARFVRWLRKHRVSVAVLALSAIALVIVGAWSLQRILAEQARAEDALAREHARADDLLVFKASVYADTDPALAAASLTQLPDDSPRWQTVDAMVAGLRARGVAYTYPSTGARMHHLEVAPARGDERLLISTVGSARLVDLRTHATAIISADADVWRAAWCGPRVALYRTGGSPQLVDPTTLRATPAPWPHRAKAVACSDDGVAVAATDGVVSAVDTRDVSAVPIAIALPEDIQWVEVAPSGRWLVAYGARRFFVLRSTAATAFTVVYERAAPDPSAAVFDVHERRLALASGGDHPEIVELDLEATAIAVRRRWAEPVGGLLRYAGGDLLRIQLDHIDRFDDRGPHLHTPSRGLLPVVDRGSLRATIVEPRRIVAVTGTARTTLRPSEAVDVVAATRDGRFVIAAGAARVYAWDGDEFAPRHATVSVSDTFGFSDRNALFGVRQEALVLVRRFAIGGDRTIRELGGGALPPATTIITYPDGLALGYDPLHDRADILEPGPHPIRANAQVTAIDQLDGASLLGGTPAGAIVRIDRATGATAETLANVGFPIIAVSARGDAMLALADGGDAWRRRAGPQETRARVPGWISAILAPDGVAYIARGNELLAWDDASEPHVVASFPQRVVDPAIRLAADDAVIVATERGALYRYDRRTHATTLVVPTSRFAVVSETGRIAAIVGDSITITDAASQRSYRLVETMDVYPSGLAISPDGTRVAAAGPAGERTELHVWELAATEPRAWAIQATNAIAPETADAPARWR